jgi:hypothetical protein
MHATATFIAPSAFVLSQKFACHFIDVSSVDYELEENAFFGLAQGLNTLRSLESLRISFGLGISGMFFFVNYRVLYRVKRPRCLISFHVEISAFYYVLLYMKEI